jgi:hypothetical protein
VNHLMLLLLLLLLHGQHQWNLPGRIVLLFAPTT